MIDETHRRGIDFHAWMNPYRVSTGTTSNVEALASSFPKNNPASNPDNLLVCSSCVILDPGIPEVQDFLVATCMELVNNYNVDGIHFDDYFYAYTRGNVLIAVSNAMNIQRSISYHSYNEGDKLCNKLYSSPTLQS